MKALTVIFFVLFFYSQQILGQKPAIDTSCYNNWEMLTAGGIAGQISSNGDYVMYLKSDQPVGITISNIYSERNVCNLLIIQSVKSSWKTTIPVQKSYRALFSSDSKYVIYKNGSDSLFICALGANTTEFVDTVKDFKLIQTNQDEYIVYRPSFSRKGVFIRNLRSGNVENFEAATAYSFSQDGERLVLVKRENGENFESVLWINRETGLQKGIWSGINASNFNFDKVGRQLVFYERKNSNRNANTIWFYKDGMARAEILVTDSLDGVGNGIEISSLVGFASDGNGVFFKQSTKGQTNAINSSMAKLNVWSYMDTLLQPRQQMGVNDKRDYLAIARINEDTVIVLERGGYAQIGGFDVREISDKFIIVRQLINEGTVERHWNRGFYYDTAYLVSLKDGSRKMLGKISRDYFMSPNGNHVVYYDSQQHNYFSFESATGTITNISKNIPFLGVPYNEPRPGELDRSFFSHLGWTSDSKSIVLADQFDIFILDLEGKKMPVNITNGYGRRNFIEFRFLSESPNQLFEISNEYILSAFNKRTKDNGFFKIRFDHSADPQKLTLGKFLYYAPTAQFKIRGHKPIKAAAADVWLISRMNAEHAPNCFVTKNFIDFSPISNISPEKKFNWYKTELHQWKSPDGISFTGILYKPENFDSTQKYPVIFYCYELISDGLNAYLPPEPSDGRLNIAWYVSNGYLVFCPDIKYKIGFPGTSALNVTQSAAIYLSLKKWVDSKRMGLQGISWGGYEANFILTQSNLFVAVCAASGSSDVISHSMQLRGREASNQGMVEVGQYRMGTSLWERPDLYIKSSPVFYAHKVNAPLLLFHTTVDVAVGIEQAIEMFIALRRLGKKVWMLEYNDGNHGVWGKSAMDFDLRMQQFFDHYLKDYPAPMWMLYGVPAKMKGVDDGLELVRKKDENGRWITPGPGLLIPEVQKKVDALKNRKPIIVKLD